MKKLLLILMLAQAAVAGDRFGIGARVGIPLTDAYDKVRDGDFTLESSTKRFTAGPSAELFLPLGFGLELDVLYKKTDVDVSGGEAGPVSDSVRVWEIPLLAKYRFPGLGLRPFLGAGGAFRSFGDLPSVSTNLKDSGWGAVVGAGLEIKIRRLRISPEFRFTRWGSGQSGDNGSVIKYSRNQADFLLGFTF
jgi:hypothetical protein